MQSNWEIYLRVTHPELYRKYQQALGALHTVEERDAIKSSWAKQACELLNPQ